MDGPYALGTLSNSVPSSQWDWETGRLTRGQRYRVTEPFVDADGDHHQAGEEWLFISSLFSRFDDELTLCVRSNFNEEWKVRLLWKSGGQGEVIENFIRYVVPVA